MFSMIPLPASAVSNQPAGEPVTESILLSPTSKRYDRIAAGSTRTDSFQIINDGKTSFNFVVYARPYSVNNESYAPDFISAAQNADAYKWVQFDKTSYFVEPGKTIEVPYTIRVPKDAAPGGHYGVLFAETQPTESAQGTSIIRKKRVGAILYATVDGNVKTSGKLQSIDAPFFQFKSPLTIRQRVSNSGNTDFQVSSNVTAKDIFGGLKYKSSKEATVLPSSTRQIINDWQDPSWIGLYKVDVSTKFLDTNSTSTHYVLLIPIWVYVTLAVLIGARVLYAVAAHRKRKK